MHDLRLQRSESNKLILRNHRSQELETKGKEDQNDMIFSIQMGLNWSQLKISFDWDHTAVLSYRMKCNNNWGVTDNFLVNLIRSHISMCDYVNNFITQYGILWQQSFKKRNAAEYLCFAQVVFLLQLCHVVLVGLEQCFSGEVHDLEKFLSLGNTTQEVHSFLATALKEGFFSSPCIYMLTIHHQTLTCQTRNLHNSLLSVAIVPVWRCYAALLHHYIIGS